MNDIYFATLGGVIIGVAVSIMLIFNGRVTGISGIVNGAINPTKGDTLWRWNFIIGLFLGGLILKMVHPEVFLNMTNVSNFKVVVAGLLVGFGTIMGSGCTSGHGVCGISRLSPRSILATLTFIAAGVLTVSLFNQ